MTVAFRESTSTVAEARARRRAERADEAVADLMAASKGGRPLTPLDRVASVRQLVEQGRLETYEPLLPLLFTLKGRPYTLTDHFVFGPQFSCHLPARSVLKTGRQVSKTTSIASSGILLANASPHRTLLYVSPLYEQIRRLSGNYVRPFIDQSPVRDLWTGTTTENSVLQRSFKNASKMIFSFAMLDADRIRGISADMVSFDEAQDFDSEHIPIIRETMAVSDWQLERYTGTPKTLDNTMEGLWGDSSMAEWFVPCFACSKMNIPALEFDLLRMIGPYSDDIGPHRPATICANPGCGRPIDPRLGRWVHRERERRWDFSGYHVPQVLLPMHYARPRAWASLLAKQQGAGNTAPHVFINEVLGESASTGNRLLSLDDIRRAATLPWRNRPDDPDAQLFEWLMRYSFRVLAIDWGGGGSRRGAGMAASGGKLELTSYTTLALLGWRGDGQIHVLWGKRLLTPTEHVREAIEIVDWAARFNVNVVAHDFTGAGSARETIMVQAGMPIETIMPMLYVGSATSSLITHIPASPLLQRDHYNLDKTRSLLYMINALKLGSLRFFADDFAAKDNPGLLRDLLALVDEKVESARARDIYVIRKVTGQTDDFAHSVNIGCAALWHTHGWPDFAALAGLTSYRLSPEQLRSAGYAGYGFGNSDPADDASYLDTSYLDMP